MSDSAFATRCVHAGSGPHAPTGAVVNPIHQSSNFILDAPVYEAIADGRARDHAIYSRYGNPSQWAVQEKLAALEGAESALLFASGMAAISSAILAMTSEGGRVVASNTLYGGTLRFLNDLLPTYGRSVTLVPPDDVSAAAAACTEETELLFFETLSNPLLHICDVPALAAVARDHGARLAVDATFSTPALQRPLDQGADLVVHSASKYLNGHSDVIAGAAAGPRSLVDELWAHLLLLGGSADPHAAFLLERGMRTLHVRMRQHVENAQHVAEYLEQHPAVSSVRYPGLHSHPQHGLAQAQMDGAGAMITFTLKGGDEAGLALCDRTRLAVQATSLGGIETLISMPFNTSHAHMSDAEREALGILPGTVRLSVGIESADDLCADLASAL